MFFLWFSEHITFDVNCYTIGYWFDIKPASDAYNRAWKGGYIY